MKAIYLHAIALLARPLRPHLSATPPISTPLTPEAKTVETRSGWEFTVAPYFWAAGISGDVTAIRASRGRY